MLHCGQSAGKSKLMNDIDFAWLAGIIDGEGNFYVNSKVAEKNKKKYLDAKVRISSTDMRMIKRISEIYAFLNLKFHFARVNMNRGSWKPAISINLGTHAGIAKLLKIVYPFLVNKKDLASIFIKILDFVMAFPKGGNTVQYNYFDTTEMIELISAYEKEKAWYFDPSTTSRKANSIFEFGDKV